MTCSRHLHLVKDLYELYQSLLSAFMSNTTDVTLLKAVPLKYQADFGMYFVSKIQWQRQRLQRV